MAQITWRNVDAPNFGGVNDSLRTFGSMLGTATGGLSDAIGNFQNSQRQQAGNEVFARSLQFQDPNEYRNALASGQLTQGIDPTLIDRQTLQALDARTGALQEQQQNQLKLDAGNYSFDRTKQYDATQAQLAPAVNALTLAYQSGDPRQVQAAQAKYGSQLNQLPADELARVLGTFQTQGGVGIGQNQSRFNLGTAMRDDADSQSAQGVMAQITRAAENPDDARTLAEYYSSQLSPGAQARLQGLLSQKYPGTYGNGVVAGAGGMGGAPGTRDGSPYDVTYGYTPTSSPISSMTMGDVVNHQQGMKSQLGASPVGAYQINQDTLKDFGPKVFGQGWESMQMTPENQDKLGEAIFNARKNGNLKDTWAALPDSGTGAYKDKSWSEMKSVIAKAEGTDPYGQLTDKQANQNVSSLAAATIGQRALENDLVGITPDYIKNLSNTSTKGEVAAKLLASDDFRGANANWVRSRLDDITNRANTSPAMAAAIMQRALTGVPESMISRGLAGLNPFTTREAGNDSRLDDNKVDAMIESLKRGEPLEAAIGNQAVKQSAANIIQAQQSLDNANAALQNTQQKIASGQTALKALLPSRQANVNRAQAILTQAQGAPIADPANLAPNRYKSNNAVANDALAEDKARAKRYLEQLNQIPGLPASK